MMLVPLLLLHLHAATVYRKPATVTIAAAAATTSAGIAGAAVGL
jgi:hypothetical protein